MSGDVHPNPGTATKYPCPVFARNVTSQKVSYQCNRCSGWVHAKYYGILKAAQYRRSSDWACDPCSTPPPPHSPTPSPPTLGSNDIGIHVVELSGNKRRLQIEITFILTVCCSFQRVFCLGSVRSDSIRPQSRYVDDRTVPNSCSFWWRATYIRIQVLHVPETSPVEE